MQHLRSSFHAFNMSLGHVIRNLHLHSSKQLDFCFNHSIIMATNERLKVGLVGALLTEGDSSASADYLWFAGEVVDGGGKGHGTSRT